MLAGQYSVVASHWITCQFKDLVRRLSRAVTAEGHGHIWCISLRLALEVKSNVPFMTFRAAASLLPVGPSRTGGHSPGTRLGELFHH
jgi:hypothetical protein